MGFDPMKLRTYSTVLEDSTFDFGVRSLEDIGVISADQGWRECLSDTASSFLAFKPYPGWVGHIEITA